MNEILTKFESLFFDDFYNKFMNTNYTTIDKVSSHFVNVEKGWFYYFCVQKTRDNSKLDLRYSVDTMRIISIDYKNGVKFDAKRCSESKYFNSYDECMQFIDNFKI